MKINIFLILTIHHPPKGVSHETSIHDSKYRPDLRLDFDAGYKFNDNIAVEGRYWFGLSSSQGLSWRTGIPSDITIDAWGLYVKPMYPVSPAFDIYALLGYAGVDATYDIPNGGTLTSDTVNGFSWGIGIRISKFHFSYARSAYHLAGSPNYITLTTNLSDFFVKKN